MAPHRVTVSAKEDSEEYKIFVKTYEKLLESRLHNLPVFQQREEVWEPPNDGARLTKKQEKQNLRMKKNPVTIDPDD